MQLKTVFALAIAAESANAKAEKIFQCVSPGMFAMTFDDGPSTNVPALLSALKDLNVKATFFVNGNNYVNLESPVAAGYLKSAFDQGHQIASHTYSHKDLSTLNTEGRRQEMEKVASLISGIIGKKPLHMRPPYLATDDATLTDLGNWGYQVIDTNLDTKDFETQGQSNNVQLQHARVDPIISASDPTKNSFISLNHDFTPRIDQWARELVALGKAKGYRFVTVEECIGKPAYSTSTTPVISSPTPSVSSSLPAPAPGSCGPRQNCLTGECCSQYGWCGTSKAYCGVGCQPQYGLCDGVTPQSVSSVTPAKPLTTVAPPVVSATLIKPSVTTSMIQPTVSPQPATLPPPPLGSCGPLQKCTAGQCCSRWGWCGVTADYCGANWCQPQYGLCEGTMSSGGSVPDTAQVVVPQTKQPNVAPIVTKPSAVTAPTNNPIVLPALPIGSCGPLQNCKTGECCSQWGWCGVTADYCGVNWCQPQYGLCDGKV